MVKVRYEVENVVMKALMNLNWQTNSLAYIETHEIEDFLFDNFEFLPSWECIREWSTGCLRILVR